MRPAQRALSRERSELHFDAQPVRPLLKRLFTSRVPPLTNIGSRIDLIDDLEVGENLPRRKLFDFLLVQAVEPIKERPLVRRRFGCFLARGMAILNMALVPHSSSRLL